MNMVTTPTLPPKRGYVEVDIDGKRTYRNIKTGALIDTEPVEPEPTEADDTAAMLVDHEYRLTLLELGLTE